MSEKFLSDEQLLGKLLELDEGQLTSLELDAFAKMRDRGKPLSAKQRNWIRSTAERLGIQDGWSRNAFSALSKKAQNQQRAQVRTQLPWELPGYRKAVRPPGGRP